MSELATRRCTPCDETTPRLSDARILELLAEIPGWFLVEEGRALTRTVSFPDYWQTMAFVNAVAWIAHGQDHHPDMGVHYNRCVVRYSTHAAQGLTENDFICAARVNALL
jgi:4a-hydroxytetrahydrobiopterin dehydratase